MSLFKSLGNALHRVSVHTGRTRAPQDLLAMSDRLLQDSEFSSEQKDSARALPGDSRTDLLQRSGVGRTVYEPARPGREGTP